MKGFNYFKVSDLLLDIDIKKSELWVYLTHCRSSNVKKSKQTQKDIRYSLASLTRVREIFGNKANKTMYDKAIISLEEKGLIRQVSIAEHGINKKFFKIDKAIEVIETNKAIQIPLILLESNLITNLNKDDILTIIKLYNHYDPLKLGSVDDEFISAYDSTNDKGYYYTGKVFGEGFNKSIYKEKILQLSNYDEIDTDIDKEIISRLIDKSLFSFKPVIVQVDLEDEFLYELKYELFKGIVGFTSDGIEDKENRYITSKLAGDERILWVLEPTHSPYTEPYIKYSESREMAYTRALFIYTDNDMLTDRGHSRYALYDETIYEYMVEFDLLDNNTLENINNLKYTLQGYTYRDSSLALNGFEEELKSFKKQEKIEKDIIANENKQIELMTGTRSRISTNDNLKAIRKRIETLNKSIDVISDLEKKLLDIIPLEAIERFYYESGYEVENIGRARRFISNS